MTTTPLSPLPASLLPSRQLDQLIDARTTYLGIPDDDLLHGFRTSAGRAAPGEPMGGWCAGNSAVIFGQIVSGLARLGAATGDADATAKAVRLFEGWRATAGPDDGDARMNTYGWDKLMGGLVDLAVHAGHADALDYAARTTRWAAGAFDRARTPAGAIDWDGRHPHGTLEWYTLGENLYRAFLLSGDTAFRDFGDVWRYPAFWDQFADTNRPGGAHSVHAYSHVNSLCSLAALYEVTGEARHLRTLVNAADYLLATQCYATGGYGPWERLLPTDGQLGRALDLCCDHAEVGCGSWAVFKLCTYLLRFTGEARWGDWIERVVYNLIGAAMPVRPDGRTTYYADYRPSGGAKLYYEAPWPCCSGTYIQAVAAYHDLIYFANDDGGLSVVLYVPSEVRHGGVTVRQSHDFPRSDRVRLTIACDRPTTLALRLRVPGWCGDTGATATIGGVAVSGAAGTWLTLSRTWRDGDAVDLHLPMLWRLEPVDAAHPTRAAVCYGPLVMAQHGRYHRPLTLRGGADELNQRMRPAPDKPPLWFVAHDDPATPRDLPSGFFRPLYDFPEAAPYRVYHDVAQPFLY